jgi:hypothetical protein
MKARHLAALVRPLPLPLTIGTLIALWPVTLGLWLLFVGWLFVRYCLVPPLARALRKRRGRP